MMIYNFCDNGHMSHVIFCPNLSLRYGDFMMFAQD
jgi:hypothetical protein